MFSKQEKKNIYIHFDTHTHTCLIRSASYRLQIWYERMGLGIFELLWIIAVYTWISASVSMEIYDDNAVFANDVFQVSCFEIQKINPNSNQYSRSIFILLKIVLHVGGILHLNPHNMLSFMKNILIKWQNYSRILDTKIADYIRQHEDRFFLTFCITHSD